MTMNTPEQFLTSLWGAIPQGRILIWTLPDKKSRWYVHFENVTGDMRFHEREDVYTGVGLAPKDALRLPSNKRLKEWEVAGIAAFWADIDVAHPVHKKSDRLPPSIERALEAIAELPFQATIIVDSGHGLQLWWALDEPWLFQDEEDLELARRACQWWHRMVKEAFAAHGWTVDSTFDLARVMRLPGTWNNKEAQDRKRVEVLENPGPRYGKQQFIELIPEDFQATPMGVRRGRSTGSGGNGGGGNGNGYTVGNGGLALDPDAEPPALKLESLLKADVKFRRSWERSRSDLRDQSPSGYDMSLASIATRAGWSPQEIVNTLITWRRKHGLEQKWRLDYYERTLEKAKAPIRQNEILERLQSGTNKPQGEEVADSSRHLRDVSKLLGIDIHSIDRYPKGPSSYVLHTDRGAVEIDSTDTLMSPRKLAVAVADATKFAPKITDAVRTQWPVIVQIMLDACEDRDIGEASDQKELLKVLLEDYLRSPASAADMADAMRDRAPFVRNGRIEVHFWDLSKYITNIEGHRIELRHLGKTLHQLGARPNPNDIPPTASKGRSTYRTWILPTGLSLFFLAKDSDDQTADDADHDGANR